MPPRKSTAASAPVVTVEVVPVDPDAGVTFADHRAASAMMLRALAGLDAQTALERLRTLYASLPNGTARRAVLAARLAILRDDLTEPAKLAAPPPVVPPPVVKPTFKPGALSTLALDAAAKLLFDADAEEEEEPPPPPPPKSKAAPPVADLFAALAATDADDDEDDWATERLASPDPEPVLAEIEFPDADLGRTTPKDMDDQFGIAEPAPDADPEPELTAKPARAKGKPRKAKSVTLDTAAIAALMEPDETTATVLEPEDAAVFVPIPPASMASALSVLSAFGDEAEDTPPPAAAPAAKPAFDLGAAFAALDDSDDAPVSPPDDLTRADAFTDPGPMDEPTPTTAAIAKPLRRKAAKAALPDDDIAASLSALIGEGASSSAPTMAASEVSDLLGKIEPAAERTEADQGPAKPKRKKPTSLSDVSAAFAAMNGDDAG